MPDVRFVFFLLILCCFGCASRVQKGEKTRKDYSLQVLTSSDNSSYLSVESFDFSTKSKELRPCYRINKIIFCDFKNKIKNPLYIIPGKFSISSEYIGKLDSKIEELIVKEGDSIIIKFFLKDDPEPLH